MVITRLVLHSLLYPLCPIHKNRFSFKHDNYKYGINIS